MEFFDVRMWFTKTGNLKFISHLDLNRFMQRALKRAKLPLWHTEGFNPHPYVTFALPLSLGQESECEIVDFRLTQPMAATEVKEAIQAVFPPEMTVLQVAPPIQKAKMIAFSAYRIVLPGLSAHKDTVTNFLCQPSIPVVKRTKKGGETTVDLAPALREVVLKIQKNDLIISLQLPAGSTLNLNPTLLTGVLLQTLSMSNQPVFITRTAILTADGQAFS